MKDEQRSRMRLSPEVRLPQPVSPTIKTQERHPITLAFEPLLRGMCSYPGQLVVDQEMDSPTHYILTVSPNRNDFAIICGKKGRQIRALTFLVAEAGRKFGIRAEVELEENYRGDPRPPITAFSENPNFDENKFLALFGALMELVFPGAVQTDYIRMDDRLKVYITPAKPGDDAIINALADVVYVFGYRQGRKIEVRESAKKLSIEQ